MNSFRLTSIAWAVVAAVFAAPALAQNLQVTNSNDVVNGCTTNPACLIGSNGGDGISLREALLAANGASGPVTITFNQALAGQTIALTTRFAPLTHDGITITGLTNNGLPNITLDPGAASNPGPLLFVAASNFAISGVNFSSIPSGFSAIQIGGHAFGLQGQNVNAPANIGGFQIRNNSFNNGANSNVFAIWIQHTPNTTSNATISNAVIANNTFNQVFESINLQGGGTNNVIQDVVIYGNSFSQNTSLGTSAVEIGDTVGSNTVIRRVQVVQNTFTNNFQGAVLNINSTTSGSSIQDTVISRNYFAGNLQAMGIAAGVDPASSNNTISNTQIVNNVVDLQGYQGQGSGTIQIVDSQNGGVNNVVNGVTFANNTIYASNGMGPPGQGIWITSHGNVNNVGIVNSIFAGLMTSGAFNGVSPSQVNYSIVNQSGFTGVNHNFNADPMFVNAGSDNFHLQAASPARGAGTGTGAPATDFDCQPRAAAPSIGAFEFNGPAICPQSPPSSTTATHDFNGDGKSDILWRANTGDTALWLMNGGTIASAASLGNVPTSWSIVGQRDFDGDGKCDILWRDTSGNVAIWLMNGAAVSSSVFVGNVATSWSIAGTGDFNSDGKGDILWHDSSGNVAIWLMNGGAISSSAYVGNVPINWSIAGSAGNGIVWRSSTGDVALWRMNGGTITAAVSLGNVPTSWTIVGAGDFDGDGNTDILWRDNAGNVAIWLLNGSGGITSSTLVANVATTWSIVETGDFDGNGKSDILWRDTSGNTAIWFMNGAAVSSAASVANVATTWSIQGAGAD